MSEPRDDEALMAAYAGGEFAAFEALFERHRGGVFTFLLQHVGDRGLAEDLLQDVFLRIVKARASYQPGRRFRPWLFSIVRNAVTDSHRRRAVRDVVKLDEDLARPEGAPTAAGDAADAVEPVHVVGDADLRAAIERAVAKLPDEQREVFLLRERGELDFESIARITGAGLATVKSRMRYALGALRRHLSQLENVVFEQ